MYKVEFDSETDGNWCSQCASQLYATREEAQAAIDADPTAGPDEYGNTCTIEIVWVGEPRDIDDERACAADYEYDRARDDETIDREML